ncbi:MAG: 4-alpha-glucanotransferase [Gammaproteobacteria bacterium]|nr:4-alpha-glucanotransferase [Gammaproteobacteria bacterium]
MKSRQGKTRRAGIILHPTSLPGPHAQGNLGPEAYHFVEFLAANGLRVWQVLPLGPTHGDGSPYQCLSANAGNPNLISPELLQQAGWLGHFEASESHTSLLHRACQRFTQQAPATEHEEFADFIKQQGHWLPDYALYQAIKGEYAGHSWLGWPAALRNRDPHALGKARTQHDSAITQTCFEQFIFFRQWDALKRYANAHGVTMFGDMPIFVAHDSSDVWSRRDMYDLNPGGQARVVAGVPPDYFAEHGQRWGNPHYNWQRIRDDGFRCWRERMRTQLRLFDLIRIDHFRGFEAYWEIPAELPTAEGGRWVKTPGDELFAALKRDFGRLPLVAEDLGLITPEVHALRKKYKFPGMKILQFAFDGDPHNPYLPPQHEIDSVVYTGTHDNDTTLGWFNKLGPDQKRHINDYLGAPEEPMPWPLIRMALASVANLAILPMQDILALDSEHRMNIPGTTHGNWKWRFDWAQITPDITERLRHLTHLYNRVA